VVRTREWRSPEFRSATSVSTAARTDLGELQDLVRQLTARQVHAQEARGLGEPGGRMGGMGEWMRKAGFAILAGPRVVASALRVARLARRVPLRELPARLRAVGGGRAVERAGWWDGVAVRLLPLLPPYGYGRCLKRSLLLLDLWSRCGLEPRLHLGVRRPGESPLEGHAWVTTGVARLDRRTGPEGWQEMWSG